VVLERDGAADVPAPHISDSGDLVEAPMVTIENISRLWGVTVTPPAGNDFASSCWRQRKRRELQG
jgi:hypothetical protein